MRSGSSAVFNFVWGLLILIGVAIGEFSPFLCFFGGLGWFAAGISLIEWLGPEYLMDERRRNRR